MTGSDRLSQTPDLEELVERRLNEYSEVPDLLEWHLPVGAAMLQLIAEDRPLTAEEIASVLGWPVAEVKPRFEEVLEYGVTYDSDGNLKAAETSPDGVTLPVYRVQWLDTGKVAALPGCASDALSPALSTGRRARIELDCPTTGQPISVQVGPAGEVEGVEPPDAVAIALDLESDWHPRDWTRSDCATGLLFASAEAAASWLTNHPGFLAVPIEFFVRAETRLYARALAHAAHPTKLTAHGAH